jgi:hypothetical protein
MTMREDFAADLAMAIDEIDGLAEPIRLTFIDGTSLDSRGVWAEQSGDQTQATGGGSVQLQRSATCRLSFASIEDLPASVKVTRLATDQVWYQTERPRLSDTISWILTLGVKQPERARS